MAWSFTSSLFHYFEKRRVLAPIYATREEGEKVTQSTIVPRPKPRFSFFSSKSKYQPNDPKLHNKYVFLLGLLASLVSLLGGSLFLLLNPAWWQPIFFLALLIIPVVLALAGWALVRLPTLAMMFCFSIALLFLTSGLNIYGAAPWLSKISSFVVMKVLGMVFLSICVLLFISTETVIEYKTTKGRILVKAPDKDPLRSLLFLKRK